MRMEGYWRIGDVALYIGVHPQTVRRWDRLGILRPKLVSNGQRRYDSDDVIRFVRKMRRGKR